MERRLAAILAADMVGYSRLMAADETGTIERQRSHRADLIDPKIAQYSGRIVKTTGDGMLVEFPSIVDAVQCALAIQREMPERETGVNDAERIRYRIGINLGDIVIDGDDILGDGVNVAARLEGLSEPGGLCISDVVYQNIQGKIELEWEDLGEQTLKNMERKVRAWHWLSRPTQTGHDSRPTTMRPPLPDKPSIAVLPFTNMSGDPEQEYFSSGITEDIITALSRISGLLVVARSSTMVYKGRTVDIKQISREQGVRYVLEGSVRKAGNRVRVTAQLIDSTTGHHQWADHYDRELNDIFAVQDEITRNVTVEMRVHLTEGEQARMRAGSTESVEAWEHMVRGMELCSSHVRENNLEAQRQLESALQLDPRYAAAWAWLGWVHWEDGLWGWSESREESLNQAIKCAKAAIDFESTHPDGLCLLGMCYMRLGRYDDALLMLEKGIRLAPNHSYNIACLSLLLRVVGRVEESLRQIKRAMRLCPISPMWYFVSLGANHHLLGNQVLALENLHDAVRREPDSLLPKPWLTSVLIESGLETEAKAVAEDMRRLDSKFTITSWIDGFNYKDASIRARLLGNLTKSGLPE